MKILLTLFVVYIVLCLFLFIFQKRFIYIPFAEFAATPNQIGLAYRDVYVNSNDGPKIHGWIVDPIPGWAERTTTFADDFAPDAAEAVRGHLLFFHGNGGNISYSMDSLHLFADLGFRTFIIDYRGYGLSEGRPGEQGLYADAEAALGFFCDEYAIGPKDIVYVGRSLGGGVALELALRQPPAALVLESAFTSVRDMAGLLRYLVPVQWIVLDKYDNLAKIERLATPLLIIHSKEDEIIPFDHSRQLFDAAGRLAEDAGLKEGELQKKFLEIEGDHNSGYFDSGDLYREGLAEFVERHLR